MPASAVSYPFPDPPGPSQAAEIAEGVLWARLPLPFRPEDPITRRTRRVQDRQGVLDEDQPTRHPRHDGSAPLAW